MRRPGFLSGFEGYTPRATTYTSSFRGLGAFGKGFVAPPPGPPPPGGVPGGKVLTHAVNKQTGKFYVQDPQCPEEGTKMMDVSEACQGADCCDAPGDCDPPGTVYTEKACDDDPQYRELPLPPPSGWASCEHRKSAGYPDPCDKTTCPECFAEKPKQQPQQQAQPKQVEDPAIRAKMQAELQQLESEAAAVEAMPKVAVLAPPSAYTGGGMPSGLPRRARKTAPTREQQVQSIVSDFETRKAMQRTLAPAPRPSAPAPAPERPLPPPPVNEDTGGLFSWLKRTLFGGHDDYVAAGLGEHKHYDNTKLLVALAGLFLLIKLINKR